MMHSALKAVDSVSHWVGSAARWLVVALIAVAVYDIISRYVFNAPAIWAYETSTMLGGALYALGWAYCQVHDSHIRVDIFYGRLSQRGKAILDIVLSLVFFFPLFTYLLRTSFWAMVDAWRRGEVMQETFWYPPSGPFRTVIVIGVFLLFVQFIATFIRNIHIVAKGRLL